MIRRTTKRLLLGCLVRVICMLIRPRMRSPDCGAYSGEVDRLFCLNMTGDSAVSAL
jgi:hypothetical protein